MVNNLFEDLRDTQIIVDTTKIGQNMTLIKDMVGEGVEVMAVIKANGYGHGAVGIAPAHSASHPVKPISQRSPSISQSIAPDARNTPMPTSMATR